VNTWKEEKQAKIYERKILKENLNQLKEDYLRFQKFKSEIDDADKSLYYLITFLNDTVATTDSLAFHIYRLGIKNFMVHNKSAYESLKSGGLERISNDSIRMALTQLHETYFLGAEIMINDVLRDRFKSWETNYKSLFLDRFYIDKKGIIKEKSIPPTRELLEEQRFSTLLDEAFAIISILRNTYQNYLIPSMEKTIKLIEKELGSSLQKTED
ncbi:hypothetical protein, partial [Aegicerativicinus sediminis]